MPGTAPVCPSIAGGGAGDGGGDGDGDGDGAGGGRAGERAARSGGRRLGRGGSLGWRKNGVCGNGIWFLRQARSNRPQEGRRRVIAGLEGPRRVLVDPEGPRRANRWAGRAQPLRNLETQLSENARRRPLPSDLRWHCAPRADRAAWADRRPARAGLFRGL